MPNYVVCSMANVMATFIELINQNPDIAGFRYEHAVVDAIQRHRSGSPYAVRVWSVIDGPASHGGIAPIVELHQDVACGLARLLCVGGGQNGAP